MDTRARIATCSIDYKTATIFSQRNDLHAAPGTVLSDGKTYLAVATADGALALTDVQLAGKKRMDVKSFLLGFREPTSYGTSQGTSKAEIAKTKPADV